MKKPFADEFDVSAEHQFWGESSFRAAYIRKQVRNQFAAVDVSRLGRFSVPVTLSTPIQDFTGGKANVTTGTQSFNLLDLPDKPTPVNEFINVPDGSYDYDTLQFAFNKRFRTGLFIQASYDYQWRDELRGTNPSTSPLNSDPLNIAYIPESVPDGGQPPAEHQLAGPPDRTLRLQIRHWRCDEPAHAERVRVRAHHEPHAAQRGHDAVLRREHR